MVNLGYPFEERRNLRPYILLLCFFWGLVCGFVWFLRRGPFQPPPPELPRRSPTPSVEAPPPRPLGTPPPGPLPVSTPLPVSIPEVRASVSTFPPPQEAPQESIPPLDETPPDLPPLQLSPQWGLTGKTAKLPPLPLPLEKPSPRIEPPPPPLPSGGTVPELPELVE